MAVLAAPCFLTMANPHPLPPPPPTLLLPSTASFFSWEAMAVFAAWFGGLALLHLILPGRKVEGAPLPNGGRLTYKINGGWRASTEDQTGGVKWAELNNR